MTQKSARQSSCLFCFESCSVNFRLFYFPVEFKRELFYKLAGCKDVSMTTLNRRFTRWLGKVKPFSVFISLHWLLQRVPCPAPGCVTDRPLYSGLHTHTHIHIHPFLQLNHSRPVLRFLTTHCVSTQPQKDCRLASLCLYSVVVLRCAMLIKVAPSVPSY